ncbi:kinase C inhibitor [Culex quinquefasciatus]|uniref:Adenosine 5'-monophosphoramidase HINT3 n=1 Tax=Culex quinquefasciatus TaxID=7176 RepID=B0VZT3_CULQU|nr:histidine triad nucleotide-binding protein 3 [Culex quinquefasciatus]XP_039435933.1 adenosine 5'-monophosphoramidase HINT3-like [Culex pipiens pallens]EDS35175.1 kinase C inhibitor [Culex quinquefasciatus]|eukprot:XP_001841967.1 kinase C inhibitor [Culex quinquefasciatus]
MTSPATTVERCIFCKIATGADPSATIMFQNERICIFKDIRPAADHHLLAVPKHHVASVRALTTADRPLLEEMRAELENVMRDQCQIDPVTMAVFGFHVPPFVTVKHLHMHGIAPTGNMGFISKMIFKPNTMWFNTDAAVIDKLPPGPAAEDGASK